MSGCFFLCQLGLKWIRLLRAETGLEKALMEEALLEEALLRAWE